MYKQDKQKNNGRVAAFKRDTTTRQNRFTQTGKKTAPTSKPGVREVTTKTNPKRSKPMHPEAKIHDFVDKHFGTDIYAETAEFAVENLCEAGIEVASLFDANTGAVTEKGLEIISEAVEEAWDRYLDLCKDTYNEPIYVLPELLSDRTVLDFMMANAVKQPWMAEAQAKHRKAAAVA